MSSTKPDLVKLVHSFLRPQNLPQVQCIRAGWAWRDGAVLQGDLIANRWAEVWVESRDEGGPWAGGSPIEGWYGEAQWDVFGRVLWVLFYMKS